MAAHFSAAVVWHALMLTMLGASGTALGGLMIVASPSQPSTAMLGLIQGLAAGLMLCISMLDLMPNAVSACFSPDDGPSGGLLTCSRAVAVDWGVRRSFGIAGGCWSLSGDLEEADVHWSLRAQVEAVGFPVANGSFFAGVAFFAMIVALVPEPDCTALLGPQPKDKDLSRMGARRNSYDHLAAGVGIGARRPSIEAALGHAHLALESGRGKTHRARGAQAEVLSSGLITALGIAIHNFPEGIAVFLASMKVRRATSQYNEAVDECGWSLARLRL
jgi:zinc transporter ZupT